MKKGRLIAFFLFVLLIGTGLGYFTKPAANNITLGLDLQGGFEVLYDVQPVKKGDKITKDVLVSTVEALNHGPMFSVSANRTSKLKGITGFAFSSLV